jgi:ABC-type polysaccharide/polyol phosphate export permease
LAVIDATPAEAHEDKSLLAFVSGVTQVRIWGHLAGQVVSSRFRGSYLGIVWLIVQFLAFSAGGGLVWAHIFNQDPRMFIVFVGVGFAVWGFLAGSVVDGSTAFIAGAGYIKQMPLPLSVFVLRNVMSGALYCAIGVGVALAVSLAVGRPIEAGVLWVFPGAAMLLTASTVTVTAMAYLGARFRDLTHGLANIFQVLFVLTPVIYTPEILIQRDLAAFVYCNPLHSMIEIIREPITHSRAADLEHYGIAGLYTLVVGLAAAGLVKLWGKRVIYWL